MKSGPRSIGGLAWPALRLFVLTFNVGIIINLLVFSRSNKNIDKQSSTGTTQPLGNQVAVESQQHSGTTLLLSQCPVDAFDLRSNGQRHKDRHNSPLHRGDICSKLPLGATASSLWQQYANRIFQASLHPNDKDKVHAPWTSDLMRLLTPHNLEKGLRRSPNHNALQKVMNIIQAKLQDPKNAPPLEVAVVGGSVTEGGGCDKLPGRLNISTNGTRPTIRGMDCSWPIRLQYLIDAMIGKGVIRIHNLAVGGTNSYLAVPVLDYWLFPQGSVLLEHGPDVIINAYAANDNLPPADKRGSDTNMTGDFSFFLNDGLERAQRFIRTSLFSRPCQDDPLVLFVDEYVGNQHNFIIGELFRFEAVDQLTDWYPTAGAVSSAQVVRRWLYADTTDDIFSAAWSDRKWPWKVDVHFGMPGHVFIAWTVAYSMLTMALGFCEEEIGRLRQETHASVSGSMGNYTDSNHLGSSMATSFVPAHVLQLVEEEVPPNLDVNLQVTDVATQWNNDALDRKKRLEEYCSDARANGTSHAQALPCSFAFVAAPMGTVRNAGALNNYMKQFIVSNDGWNGEQDMRNGWQNKLGFQANKAGASILLRIKKTPNKVKTITLHTLKSYGEKWADSKAKFSLQWSHEETGTSYNTTFEILGYHNQTTSIAYPFVLDLGPDHIAEKGSTLDMQIDLVGGTTFKINAMMLCSR